MKKFMFFCLMMSFAVLSFGLAVELKAVRVKQGPKIDGSLSEPVWQSSAVFTNFRMVEPQPNQNPTEKTELMILYDDSNLYIGVLCHDSEPSRIAANTMAHDNGGER